jgi:hypothetical protein
MILSITTFRESKNDELTDFDCQRTCLRRISNSAKLRFNRIRDLFQKAIIKYNRDSYLYYSVAQICDLKSGREQVPLFRFSAVLNMAVKDGNSQAR